MWFVLWSAFVKVVGIRILCAAESFYAAGEWHSGFDFEII